MGRGAWWATAHGATKTEQLSTTTLHNKVCARNVPMLNKLQIQSAGFFHSLIKLNFGDLALGQASTLGKDSGRCLSSNGATLTNGELLTNSPPKSYCYWSMENEGTVKHMSSQKEFHFDFMTDLTLRNERNTLTLEFNEQLHCRDETRPEPSGIFHLRSTWSFLSSVSCQMIGYLIRLSFPRLPYLPTESLGIN